MNYRMLFVISFLTLVVGIGGILFMPTDNEGEETQSFVTQPQVEKKVEKIITIAELKRDVKKGTLLQSDDYAISQVTISEDNPLINNDLSDAINHSQSKTLQGYLIADSLNAGSLLSNMMIISPDDPRFLMASLDSKQEVAYRIYINADERYLLDTINSGDYVAIYNQKNALDSRNIYDKSDLVKVSGKLLVLQTKEFQEPSDNNTGTPNDHKNKDYIGYINVKVDADKVKKFYTLDKGSKLIVLPENSNNENINHRGVFIRKLRGQ
ncbi:flp operon protein C [Bisgaard Taxon 46]